MGGRAGLQGRRGWEGGRARGPPSIVEMNLYGRFLFAGVKMKFALPKTLAGRGQIR